MLFPKLSGHIKIFIVKDGEKGKKIKFMCFHIDDEKLLEKHKTVWTKFEDFKKLNWMLCQSEWW